MDQEIPQGQRFSHVYLERGEPTDDSPRMRRRIATLIGKTDHLFSLGEEIEKELGIHVPVASIGFDGATYNYVKFYSECEIRDLLDSITVAYRMLEQSIRQSNCWVEEISRIFSEENVRYRVDPKGGVHFSIDNEFEQNRNATIAALNGSRYTNVLANLDKAYVELAKSPPNGKVAIRDVFSGAECLFRLMFENPKRLAAFLIDKHLLPCVQNRYAEDPTTVRASEQLVQGFKEWVSAAHNYRHEEGKEEPSQPPLNLAINMVSQGATWIRWLAELDAETRASEK